MRISVNLATRPFVELRPLFARLRLAMLVLALLAVGCFFYLRVLTAKAAVATAEMNSLKAKTKGYDQELASDTARMHEPQNMSVLERSQFLNALFASKSFSWTAVMMDLEKVLPGGVQVTSIEPVISKEGDVSIRLRVVGDRDRAIELVRNLETSQRFVAPRLGGETSVAPEKSAALGRPGVRNVSADVDPLQSNLVEFEIFSGYNPLPETAAKSEEKKGRAAAPKTSPKKAGPAVHHDRKPSTPAPAGSSPTKIAAPAGPANVYFVGEIVHNGPVALHPGMTILQAIDSVGGLTAFANKRKLYILRGAPGKQQKIPFDYNKAQKRGDLQGVVLLPGDTVVVP